MLKLDGLDFETNNASAATTNIGSRELFLQNWVVTPCKQSPKFDSTPRIPKVGKNISPNSSSITSTCKCWSRFGLDKEIPALKQEGNTTIAES